MKALARGCVIGPEEEVGRTYWCEIVLRIHMTDDVDVAGSTGMSVMIMGALMVHVGRLFDCGRGWQNLVFPDLAILAGRFRDVGHVEFRRHRPKTHKRG